MTAPQSMSPLRERGTIIVTPEGHAYFPVTTHMTTEEYLDWLAALNVTLVPALRHPPRVVRVS